MKNLNKCVSKNEVKEIVNEYITRFFELLLIFAVFFGSSYMIYREIWNAGCHHFTGYYSSCNNLYNEKIKPSEALDPQLREEIINSVRGK